MIKINPKHTILYNTHNIHNIQFKPISYSEYHLKQPIYIFFVNLIKVNINMYKKYTIILRQKP